MVLAEGEVVDGLALLSQAVLGDPAGRVRALHDGRLVDVLVLGHRPLEHRERRPLRARQRPRALDRGQAEGTHLQAPERALGADAGGRDGHELRAGALEHRRAEQTQRSAVRRSYGSGSIHEHRNAWYGKWRVGGRQVKRRIGPKRKPGTREGLTRTQAEAGLRQLIAEVRVAPPEGTLTLAEAGERYLRHVEHVMERRPSTVQDYACMLRQLGRYFDRRGIDGITAEDVAGYMHVKAGEGLSSKTVGNHLNFLNGVFRHAVKRGWARANPVAAVDRRRSSGADPDVRFLDHEELEALLRAVPGDLLGPTERTLYLTAAMTGLRQAGTVVAREVKRPAASRGSGGGRRRGARRRDRVPYLGVRHMGHMLGPSGSLISPVTSKPWRRYRRLLPSLVASRYAGIASRSHNSSTGRIRTEPMPRDCHSSLVPSRNR